MPFITWPSAKVKLNVDACEKKTSKGLDHAQSIDVVDKKISKFEREGRLLFLAKKWGAY